MIVYLAWLPIPQFHFDSLSMLFNFAYRTLLHDRGKLIAGLVGVIFSVVLVSANLYMASGLLVFTVCLAASAIPYWRVRQVDSHSILQG